MNSNLIIPFTQPVTALLSIDQLQPDPRNPRIHSKRQIKQIARSIQTFGFNVPILVDRHNRIIAGHGRYLAAQLLGMTEVPVSRLEHLTEPQIRAFAIADNKLTENAAWDQQLLGDILLDLSKLELDFALDVTGFEVPEIDLTIAALSAAPSAPDPQDQIPDLSSMAPVSQPGDLWQLGRHRLICGNALEEATYQRLLAGDKAHVIFSDPPYNVRIDGHVSGHGAITHREFAMASGEMSPSEFIQFLSTVFGHLVTYSHPGSIHFQCIDWRHVGEMLAAGALHYAELKNICTWVKDNGGMGSFYRSQHEFICVFKHGAAPHRNNIQLGKYGRNRTNVWHYPSINSPASRASEGDLLALHPTVKPVALIADALLDCSDRNDIVLDSFLGSGSTVLAAERTGRIAYGIEFDPLYVDTAIRRWQSHTGQQAIHVESGLHFDAIAAQTEACHA